MTIEAWVEKPEPFYCLPAYYSMAVITASDLKVVRQLLVPAIQATIKFSNTASRHSIYAAFQRQKTLFYLTVEAVPRDVRASVADSVHKRHRR